MLIIARGGHRNGGMNWVAMDYSRYMSGFAFSNPHGHDDDVLQCSDWLVSGVLLPCTDHLYHTRPKSLDQAHEDG